MPEALPRYRGRFAPSPTGDLHFGSLVAAMASYCDALAHAGSWYLRIDDIDPPRAMPGAAQRIPVTLERFGFHWEGPVRRQSLRAREYRRQLRVLHDHGRLYRCACSRRQRGSGLYYPGTCRPARPLQGNGPDHARLAVISASTDTASHERQRIERQIDGSESSDTALRVWLDGADDVDDALFGRQSVELGDAVADVVVKRRDGLFSYHLACAIDDSDDITHVVRGADLLDCTSAQTGIQRALGRPVPEYLHVPLAVRADGSKLSKHTHAIPIDHWPVLPTLLQAWEFLGQPAADAADISAFWRWAACHWQRAHLPVCTAKEQSLDTAPRE